MTSQAFTFLASNAARALELLHLLDNVSVNSQFAWEWVELHIKNVVNPTIYHALNHHQWVLYERASILHVWLVFICWLGRPLSFSMFWTSGPPFVCHSAVPGCSLLFSMFWTPWYHLFDRVKYMFDESMFFIIPHVLGCWVSIILHHSSSFLSFFQENDQTRMSMKPSL